MEIKNPKQDVLYAIIQKLRNTIKDFHKISGVL